MLAIIFTDDMFRTYQPNQFTDYIWKDNLFIVLDGQQWIGIYPTAYIKRVEYKGNKV